MDFFVLLFDRKHVLFPFKTLQILILFPRTRSVHNLRDFDQIKESMIFVSPIFLTKKDQKRVIVKENVVPRVGTINKDSGYSF